MISPTIKRKYYLRSNPAYINPAEVAEIMQKYNFYCKEDDFFSDSKIYSNMEGLGIHANVPNAYAFYSDKEIVFDRLTGLCWQREGSQKQIAFHEVADYVDEVNTERPGELSNWRIPSLEEAMSLVEPEGLNADRAHPQWTALRIHPVFNVEQRWIWTCDEENGKYWKVNFASGNCMAEKPSLNCYVRLVSSYSPAEVLLEQIQDKDINDSGLGNYSESNEFSKKTCIRCKGSGKQLCQMCGGTGSTTQVVPGLYQTTTMQSPCVSCRGSGWSVCRVCYGRGKS